MALLKLLALVRMPSIHGSSAAGAAAILSLFSAMTVNSVASLAQQEPLPWNRSQPGYDQAPPPASSPYDNPSNGYGAPTYGNAAPPARGYAPQGPGPRRSVDDAYRPQGAGAPNYGNQSYGAQPAPNDAYNPGRGGYASNQSPSYQSQPGYQPQGGYGQPYTPPPDPSDRDYGRGPNDPPYQNGPRRYDERAPDGGYSPGEITQAGRGFFGSVSQGMASVIEYAFQRQGRPNGYILGEEAGGAFVAGLRYGEGTLYTRDAGTHKVYWQGPSVGYDFGGEGSKVMVLVYNLRDPNDIFERYGGVDGSAYIVGGVGITFLARDHVTLAPIRSGVGLRLGANIGYLKYTRRPTWNPF
jgi:hypothetical protein